MILQLGGCVPVTQNGEVSRVDAATIVLNLKKLQPSICHLYRQLGCTCTCRHDHDRLHISRVLPYVLRPTILHGLSQARRYVGPKAHLHQWHFQRALSEQMRVFAQPPRQLFG